MKPTSRYGAIGQAIGGFGLFFVGIDTLKGTFETLAPMINLQVVSDFGAFGVAIMVGVGFLMTLLTQSSSAAIAITLTAATGGVIALPSAAAMVIGANVGTTSTAFFAALNATPNAKRVATAHVIFNAVTGVVALLILPIILFLIAQTSGLLGLDDTPAVALALFHTIFNVLGVVLMWPLLRRLSAWLANRFRTREETESQPQFIDKTVAVTPALALNALFLEVTRIGSLARTTAASALSESTGRTKNMHVSKEAVDALDLAAGEFATDLGKSSLDQDTAEALTQLLRLSHYYTEAVDLVTQLSDFPSLLEHINNEDLHKDVKTHIDSVGTWLKKSDTQADSFSPEAFEKQHEEIEETYHQIKDRLLRAGISDQVSVRDLGLLLDHLSALNRVIKRFLKATRIQAALTTLLEQPGI